MSADTGGDTFDPAGRQADKRAGREADLDLLAGNILSPAQLHARNGILMAHGGALARLLSHLHREDRVALVGGQSVGVWAAALDPDCTRLAKHQPFTTSDIDYFGDLRAARRFAEAVGGRLFKPSSDTMNSNSTALVRAPLGPETITVDFLHAIIGVERREILAGIEEVFVGDGHGGEFTVPVISPMLVLRSRIANMLSAATMRRDEISFNQAWAAVRIVELWAERLIGIGNVREAMKVIMGCVSHATVDHYGRRAFHHLGIDQLDAVRSFLDDDRLDDRWRTRTLARRIGECETRRHRDASRR